MHTSRAISRATNILEENPIRNPVYSIPWRNLIHPWNIIPSPRDPRHLSFQSYLSSLLSPLTLLMILRWICRKDGSESLPVLPWSLSLSLYCPWTWFGLSYSCDYLKRPLLFLFTVIWERRRRKKIRPLKSFFFFSPSFEKYWIFSNSW